MTDSARYIPVSAPERIGKYQIVGLLGRGAMGTVHKAIDPHIKRPVALKTIRRELFQQDHEAESLVARFRHEAQAAGRLAHPGIVGVYEYGEEADLAFIAMEFVEGLSLREYFSRGVRFNEPDIVSLMAQLLDALGYAHANDVWHRDIKPANLIVTAGGRLKVADFGIAHLPASDLTQAGAILGTPGYIAPEVYLGRPVDHRCDLFAAGAVLYQLLTGASPFGGAAEAVMYKVCHEAPNPPSQSAVPPCRPEYDALVATALAKLPEQRFQDAAAFRTALLEAYSQPPAETISEETIISGRSMPAESARPRTASGSTAPSTAPLTHWDAHVLADLETLLAEHLGPIARVVIRKAARRTEDFGKLVDLVAGELIDPAARARFVGAARRRGDAPPAKTSATRPGTLPSTAPPASSGTTSTLSPTPEQVERATKLLTPHLGPIARAVARRVAERSASIDEFHEHLADTISDVAQRALVLRALQNAL